MEAAVARLVAEMAQMATLLQLQQELIEAQQRDILVLRAERDAARAIEQLCQEILYHVRGAERTLPERVCVRCPNRFTPRGRANTLCAACRSAAASRRLAPVHARMRSPAET